MDYIFLKQQARDLPYLPHPKIIKACKRTIFKKGIWAIISAAILKNFNHVITHYRLREYIDTYYEWPIPQLIHDEIKKDLFPILKNNKRANYAIGCVTNKWPIGIPSQSYFHKNNLIFNIFF